MNKYKDRPNENELRCRNNLISNFLKYATHIKKISLFLIQTHHFSR